MKTICITGAAGNLGSLTARYLLKTTSHRLTLMIHTKPLPAELSQNPRVTVHRCDLADKASLYQVLDGVDEVVHYAGVLFKARPERFLPTTNTEYFKNLVDVSKRCGVRRIALISFPHVEGETRVSHPSTNRLDKTPISHHASTRLLEERYLLEQYETGVVLRVGMVYGKGILMPDAAKWFAQKGLLGVWKKETIIHLISRDDYLEVIRRTIDNQNAKGIYNIGDDGIQSLQQYLDFACDIWKCRKPWRMPEWLIYAAAGMFEMASTLFDVRSPLTRDFIRIGMVSYYGDTSRMKSDILPRLKYPTMVDGSEIF